MRETIYSNYHLVLPDQEMLGTMVVRGGQITDIQPGGSAAPGAHDGQGQYLLPGIIELHTDNLEKCVAPRPGVRWPMEAAVVYHDRQLVNCGITTVYDAIVVGDIQGTPGSLRLTHSQIMIDALTEAASQGRLMADHHLHLRCEVGYGTVDQVLASQLENPLLAMISLMDHTPGQRQFIRMDKFKEYYMGKHGLSEGEVNQFIEERLSDQHLYATKNRKALVTMAQQKGIPIASHDDATVDHVLEALNDGAAIAEFPTTLEAARLAHDKGMKVLMGAPNVVLGGSHSGNVAAMELAQHRILDILSSDYAPQSLLHAVFLIAQEGRIPLFEALKVVTLTPATVTGLSGSRGCLKVGYQADFLTVQVDHTLPLLTSVHRQGQRVS